MMNRAISNQAQATSTLALGAQQGVRVPEMELLGGTLHGLATDLSTTADQLEMKLARFLNEPVGPEGNSPVLQAAEPPPGSLDSLKSAEERLRIVGRRLETLVDKVKGIL